MTDFKDFLAEQLKDPEIRAEYDALEPEFSLMQAMIDARKRRESPNRTSASWKAGTATHPCVPWSGLPREWGCAFRSSSSR